jgi:hypothetical protein
MSGCFISLPPSWNSVSYYALLVPRATKFHLLHGAVLVHVIRVIAAAAVITIMVRAKYALHKLSGKKHTYL